MTKPRGEILTRMYVVLTLLSLAPLLVAGQVVKIYLTDGAELRTRGHEQVTTRETIPAMRGSIFDRAGRALAVNVARFDLAVDPTVRGFAAQQHAFFDSLSALTGRSAASYRRTIQNRTSPKYVLLRRGLDPDQREVVERWDVPGVILHPRFDRRFNYGTTAAHVLGHVDTDGRGIAGIEKQYDEHLHGEPGQRAVKRDRRGNIKAFVGGQVIEPKHGEHLVLTVDLIRQTIMEEELLRGVRESSAQWASAIAMDPQTGAVLAMANVPTYDPNRPAAYGTNARRNHAITDQIEPGSVFKLVPAVAALEQRVIALDDTIDTGNGYARFGGRGMHDTHGYGRLSFADVIVKSSNVGTAKAITGLNHGTFYRYARQLGFGQPTWIDLPGEVSGLLKRPDQWSGTTLTSMSIGYEVNATPLQILTAYCALANGGLLVQPYVVAERRDVTGRTVWRAPVDSIRRAFEPETAEALRPPFERVVEEGTATTAQVAGLRVAGKTGTARKVVGGRYERAYRASFVGFFPADDPKVALIVVMDEPENGYYGGTVSGPVFSRIARRWIGTFPEVAARMAPEHDVPERPEAPVPDVTGQPTAVAHARLAAAGYRLDGYDAEEAARPVAQQVPVAGTVDEPAARVRLSVASAPTDTMTVFTMPDLRGLSARQATFWLRSHGVDVQLDGSGTVTGQSPAAGAALPQQARLQCKQQPPSG